MSEQGGFVESWGRLMQSLQVDPQAGDRVGRELYERHREPQRAYHAVEHVEAVLRYLDALDERSPVTELTAFFHDAVYDPMAGDNEAQSAELATERLGELGIDDALIDDVAVIIRATAGHSIPDDPPLGAAAFLDADLAILGASPERYAWYSGAIRREYAHVPDEHFGPRRAAILRGFLERDELYFTEAGVELWNAQARRNLSDEIAQLAQPATSLG